MEAEHNSGGALAGSGGGGLPALPGHSRQLLGELLLDGGLITEAQLGRALQVQREKGGRLGSILVRLGILSDEEVAAILSRQHGILSVDLNVYDVDPEAVALLTREQAIRYNALPLSRAGNTLTVAMIDPTNVFAIDDIKFVTGLNVQPVIAASASLVAAIERHYNGRGLELAEALNDLLGVTDATIEDAVALMDVGDDEITIETLEGGDVAPAVRLVNLILFDALRRGASDIHIEPYEKEFRVRFRLDGLLYHIMNPPLKMRAALTSRLKIMARLDIAEKRLPQDGRIRITVRMDGRARAVDFRASTLPTIFGEKIVLRVLDRENLRLDLRELGFEAPALTTFRRNIEKPYGMVLVTGPTGSGKTSTLYSALQSLNVPGTNIMTAEDPVEFNLTGVNQVQMKEAVGLNFAAALRSFLRQDPNIILVGEIRDFETAEIAIKAALTGHMVLSTLHTNDAPSTVSRLMNMGIEPFLVATSVNLIQAQRLVRRVCTACATEARYPADVLVRLGFRPSEVASLSLLKGRGCDACNGTGYKGRVGLYEVMEITDALRELILVGGSGLELRRRAMAEGMQTLRQSGLEKVRAGLTTVEEVTRETV